MFSRAIVDQHMNIVSAQDYDTWATSLRVGRLVEEGDLMENRSYQSDNTVYKFTGEERDNESKDMIISVLGIICVGLVF